MAKTTFVKSTGLNRPTLPPRHSAYLSERLAGNVRKRAHSLGARGRYSGGYAGAMRLTVLFFGVLRERFGDEERLEQFPGSTAGDLLRYYRVVAPELGDLWSSIAVAVNRTYATGALLLSDGDEVALLPPVSGGSSS